MQTKKFFLFGLLLSAVLFVFNACTKQQNEISTVSAASSTSLLEDLKVEDGRLVFKDENHVMDCMKKISSMSDAEFEQWEKSMSFHSLKSEFKKFNNDLNLYNIQLLDLKEFEFPTFRQSILNNAGEYKVGSYIVWYNKMFVYYADNELELKTIKENPQSADKKAELSKPTTIKVGELQTRSAWLEPNKWYFPKENTWRYNTTQLPSPARRYVQYIRTSYNWYLDGSVWKRKAELYLWTHLEHNASGGNNTISWVSDASNRRITANLTGSFNVQGNGQSSSYINVNVSFNQIVSMQNDILLGSGITPNITGTWFFVSSLQGTVKHQVLSAYSNDDTMPEYLNTISL